MGQKSWGTETQKKALDKMKNVRDFDQIHSGKTTESDKLAAAQRTE